MTGTFAASSASSASDIVRDTFNFSVDKFPLSGPDGMRTPWYALFRSDTQQPVGNGSVTSRYVPHTTDDVCALVDAATEAFGHELECGCYFRDGHYVNIIPSKAERLKVFGENDNVWPRVIINAGYDGRAFRAVMGYYRDACKNLAMPRRVEGTTVSIRHTSSLRSHMDDLIDTFNILKESWVSLADVIRNLQNAEVQLRDFLNEIYPEPAADASKRAVTVHHRRNQAIFDRLRRERTLTNRPDLTSGDLPTPQDNVSAWEAYNAIQGYVQHDAQAKRGFRSDFGRILRASRDSAVKKAEELAMAAAA